MASTDTRSGFRLPWSSDRSHEGSNPDGVADTATEAVEQAEPASAAPADPAWPQPDFNAALGLTRSDQRPAEAPASPTAESEEPSPMAEIGTAPAPAATTRKPSKLIADLSAAIRATAEASQVATMEQIAGESQQVVETIRASSTDGAATLKHQSEEDIAAIREWSKTEIARIREETDARITARKGSLEDELAGHAAAVGRRIEEVESEVARFESAMAAYRDRLNREDDPARLATMAEEVPELPSFAAWGDLAALDVTPVVAEAAVVAEATPVVPEAAVVAEAAAPADAAETPEAAAAEMAGQEPAATTATAATALDEPTTVDAVAETLDAEAGPDAAAEPLPATDWYPPADETEAVVETPAPDGWGDETNAWTDTTGIAADATDDGVPRWAAGETPEGFPTGDGADGGDPVDRGAIMAALEAAAEAVVAAESAAESADQAEAAADVAETAAELLVGRTTDEEYDPEAAAAMSARVDAGGYETETFQDRLASLTGHADGVVGDEERTTQVVVAGLVSVASIASFKRHLGRLTGVQAVAVASGPEGEFVFNVTHRADLSFRDVLPTMPGFAARVTGTADGVVNVTARDPEAEG